MRKIIFCALIILLLPVIALAAEEDIALNTAILGDVNIFVIDVPPLENLGAEEYANIYLLAQLLYHECRGESLDVQKKVAQVPVNRMAYENDTLRNVIYSKNHITNQFTPAKNKTRLEKTIPTYDNMLAAFNVYVLREFLLPKYVCFFTSNGYTYTPYGKFGKMYFSFAQEHRQALAETVFPENSRDLDFDYFLENFTFEN